MPADAEVMVIEHRAGFTQGCKKCRRVHMEGSFALGLKVREGSNEFKYFIGVDPPAVCCGEEKTFFQAFALEEEAEAAAEKIRQHLREHSSTEGLKLISFTLPGMN